MSPTRASRFHALHAPARPLRLLNAWDAGSAKVMVAAGAPALATTSAGVSFAAGLPDGQRLGRDGMLRAVAAIVAAAGDAVPVSADLEAGYGDVAGTIRSARDVGAVGFNLEDGRPDGTLMPLDEQLEILAEARSAAGDAYMNARTDGVWLRLAETEAETRARAYAEAGADGIFVPGASDPDLLRALVAAVDGFDTTINVLAVPGLPPVAELSTLGIARVSTGSGPIRAALSLAHLIARELLDDGTYAASTSGTLSFDALNSLMDA